MREKLMRDLLELGGLQVSEQLEAILEKIWQGEPLSEKEQGLEITPGELAALWTVTHRRVIFFGTTRQVLRRRGSREETLTPSRQWGRGKALRRLYRLGDALSIRVQERRTKEKDEAGQQ